jgi:chromosome segregation ATPase
MPLFWRLFGGAAVGLTALVIATVYQQMQGQLNTLRNELAGLNKNLHKDLDQISASNGGLVKKNDHDSKVLKVWETIKELRADRNDLTILKERCTVLREVLKAGEAERQRLADELRRLRERQAGEDEKRDLVREIRALRLRITQMEGALARPVITTTGHLEQQPK